MMGESEEYYRKEWMSDDQWECAKLFADLVGGFHHVVFNIKQHGNGIKCAVFSGQLSTFDFDKLTRLVIMAHDRCIRAEVVASGPRMVGVVLHKRHRRDGFINQRHPTIHEAVEQWHDANYPQPEEKSEHSNAA